MQIAFKKVSRDGVDFSLNTGKIDFFGKLTTKQNNLVTCVGKLKGKTSHFCDRCGEEMVLEIEQDVDIFVYDGIYKSNKDEEFDVVEFYDGIIDLQEILDSEIEAYRSDYHYCENCKDKKI